MPVDSAAEIVITGLGVVSPVGIGVEALRDAIDSGRSGVGPISTFDATQLPVGIAGEVPDFDPRQYVQPRKSLKVMSRDTKLGVSAARLACQDASLGPDTVAPDRLGVVFGADIMRHAMSEIEPTWRPAMVNGHVDSGRWATVGLKEANPLSLLKTLPNMLSSHVSIAHDARGPANVITMRDVSSLLAIAESAEVIRRGAADVMIAGGGSSRLHPLDLARFAVGGLLSRRNDDPAAAVRPFDADRDGQVIGEGAGAVVLETRQHAESRGAPIRARLLAWSSGFEPSADGHAPEGVGLQQAIQRSLQRAGLAPREIGHVNAHGLSTLEDDRREAQVLGAILSDVPVTAPKSYLGNLNAAAGIVELAFSLLALERGEIPPTLNYHRRDPDCPLHVVHDTPLTVATPTCLCINQTSQGQSAALVVAR